MFLQTRNCIMFLHHVFFWLKNAGNETDRSALAAGLEQLKQIQMIHEAHIGRAAGTGRSVVDNSYDVSWLLKFESAIDQDAYQGDPVHLKFVDDCKHLWEKVVVFDAIDF